MSLQVDPMQLIQLIKSGQNPQQLMLNVLKNEMNDTPMGQNLIALAEHNQVAEMEKIARNLCKSRGVDFDSAFASFKQSLGL